MTIVSKIYSLLPSVFKSILLKIIKRIDGGEAFSIHLRKIYKDIYNIEIGIGTYGCFDNKKIAPNIFIGNYCSFAQNVSIVPRREHPMNFASTSPIFFNSDWGFVNEQKIAFNELTINNDVWIGQNAIICSKCKTIGNGAIIAAGSVVIRDVPPYAVVAGVPAKIIKYRFDENTINLLEESKWYELKPDELKKYAYLAENPANFANKIIKDSRGN